MAKTAGLAVPHRLVIGDGTGGNQADVVANLANDQVNEVFINSSGLWNVGNFAEEVSALVINQGGHVQTGATGKLRSAAG